MKEIKTEGRKRQSTFLFIPPRILPINPHPYLQGFVGRSAIKHCTCPCIYYITFTIDFKGIDCFQLTGSHFTHHREHIYKVIEAEIALSIFWECLHNSLLERVFLEKEKEVILVVSLWCMTSSYRNLIVTCFFYTEAAEQANSVSQTETRKMS